MSRTIAVIGSGFSSLAAASYLAKAGHKVTLFEKNKTFGGRARQLKREGFIFDMVQHLKHTASNIGVDDTLAWR